MISIRKIRSEERQMAYNKTSEERKWNYWKEQEEKKLRELGIERNGVSDTGDTLTQPLQPY